MNCTPLADAIQLVRSAAVVMTSHWAKPAVREVLIHMERSVNSFLVEHPDSEEEFLVGDDTLT